MMLFSTKMEIIGVMRVEVVYIALHRSLFWALRPARGKLRRNTQENPLFFNSYCKGFPIEPLGQT